MFVKNSERTQQRNNGIHEYLTVLKEETARYKQGYLEHFEEKQNRIVTDSDSYLFAKKHSVTIRNKNYTNVLEDRYNNITCKSGLYFSFKKTSTELGDHYSRPTPMVKSHIDKTIKVFFLYRNYCKLIIDGDKTEIAKASNFGKISRGENIADVDFKRLTQNCSNFIQRNGYIMNGLTQEESDFPIAYSIMMYKDVEQVERLLRLIYRPQNIYCIHVDKKSNASIYNAMKSIATCFDNVFMSTRRVSVSWGNFEVLEADLICMEELLQRSKSWKYFINPTGQELPLRTNYELVKIFKAYNGANDIEGTIKR